jgi:hypothetical protein
MGVFYENEKTTKFFVNIKHNVIDAVNDKC